jgi:threonine dehydrogenase-like Zn-dependent dehydrogenase
VKDREKMKTRRAFIVEPRRIELKEIDITPNPDEIMVKIASCGLCNWELNHWKGLLGKAPQSVGHEWAGEVVEVGAAVKRFKVGDRIAMFPESELEGFSDYACIPEHLCWPVSKDTDLKYAIAEPLKCIITVARATAAEPEDNGVVLGCGPMGLWCIQAIAGSYLSSLIAVDVDDEKLALAKKYGATHTINPTIENVAKKIQDIAKGQYADFVIEGTGIPENLNTAMHYIRYSGRGKLVLMSSHEREAKAFDYRPAIDRALQIIVAHDAYATNQLDNLRRAVQRIDRRAFKVKELITHEFSLNDIQKAFETLENKPKGYLKGIVIP